MHVFVSTSEIIVTCSGYWRSSSILDNDILNLCIKLNHLLKWLLSRSPAITIVSGSAFTANSLVRKFIQNLCSANRKAVSAYLQSKHILHFVLALHWVCGQYSSGWGMRAADPCDHSWSSLTIFSPNLSVFGLLLFSKYMHWVVTQPARVSVVNRFWFYVGPAWSTLIQHWPNVSSLLGFTLCWSHFHLRLRKTVCSPSKRLL